LYNEITVLFELTSILIHMYDFLPIMPYTFLFVQTPYFIIVVDLMSDVFFGDEYYAHLYDFDFRWNMENLNWVVRLVM